MEEVKMFKYTFAVKDFGTRKFSNISKVFNELLSIKELHNEMGIIFDNGNYKNVMLKNIEELDMNGNAIRKIDHKKW